ncbi:hypothetical protein [Mucilaginibacter sp.]|jgi:hypothetical protein|uniref:hypothetical protein n=1 Tax=Mucilaginibacter sp. TaxID=1882438 RepID=UPI003564A9F1
MFQIFRKYVAGKIALTEQQFDLIQSLCVIKKLRKKQYLLQDGDNATLTSSIMIY